MLTIEEVRQLRGREVFGAGGQYLGTIHELYADNTADVPTFATIVGSGPGRAFVPLAQAVLDGGQVVVPYDAAQMSSSPAVRENQQLTPEEEHQLYQHFGITAGVTSTAAAQRPAPTRRSAQPAVASGPRLRRYELSGSEAEPVAARSQYRGEAAGVEQPAPPAQQAVEETAATAKDQAAETAQAATSAASDVAGTAKEQAQQVAGEAAEQARQLTGQAREQIGQQAAQATDRLSEKVRGLAGEVRDLSQGEGDGSGPVAELAKQLADKGEQVSEYLSRQGPDGLLRDVRAFAARRPGVFLLGTLAAGAVTGRVMKGATAADDAQNGQGAMPAGATTRLPSGPPVRPVPVQDAYPAETALPLRASDPPVESGYVPPSAGPAEPR